SGRVPTVALRPAGSARFLPASGPRSTAMRSSCAGEARSDRAASVRSSKRTSSAAMRRAMLCDPRGSQNPLVSAATSWHSETVRVNGALSFVAALTAAMLVSPSSNAEPSDAQLEQARVAYADALALESSGDWSGALAKMREVAAVKLTPQ